MTLLSNHIKSNRHSMAKTSERQQIRRKIHVQKICRETLHLQRTMFICNVCKNHSSRSYSSYTANRDWLSFPNKKSTRESTADAQWRRSTHEFQIRVANDTFSRPITQWLPRTPHRHERTAPVSPTPKEKEQTLPLVFLFKIQINIKTSVLAVVLSH